MCVCVSVFCIGVIFDQFIQSPLWNSRSLWFVFYLITLSPLLYSAYHHDRDDDRVFKWKINKSVFLFSKGIKAQSHCIETRTTFKIKKDKKKLTCIIKKGNFVMVLCGITTNIMYDPSFKQRIAVEVEIKWLLFSNKYGYDNISPLGVFIALIISSVSLVYPALYEVSQHWYPHLEMYWLILNLLHTDSQSF